MYGRSFESTLNAIIGDFIVYCEILCLFRFAQYARATFALSALARVRSNQIYVCFSRVFERHNNFKTPLKIFSRN